MSNFIKQHIARLKHDRDVVIKEIADAEAKIKEDTELLTDIDRVIERLSDMSEAK